MVRQWHRCIPPPLLMPWLGGLRMFAEKLKRGGEERITVASACSGTDLYVHCLDSLKRFWSSELAVDIEFDYVLAAEKCEAKQQFLRTQYRPAFLLRDIEDLTKTKATNLVTNLLEFIPHAKWFFAGFSCTSRSKMNVHSSANRGCIQDGQGATGDSFHKVRQFIEKCRPEFILLENVVELSEVSEDSGVSDEEYILSVLASAGFAARCFRVSCADYGSCVERDRLYFVGLDLTPSAEEAEVLFTAAAKLMDCMKVGPGNFDDCVMSAEQMIHFIQDIPPEPKAKKAREADCKWHEKDRDIFHDLSVKWPPVMDPAMLELFEGWGLRVAEIAHVAHQYFPLEVDDKWFFLDANHTLERLLRWNPAAPRHVHNPWRRTCSTLTGHSKIVPRRRRSKTKELILRPLFSIEGMRMIGWDLAFWRWPVFGDLVTQDVLVSLAGNAFSGYALTPLVIAVIGRLGRVALGASSCQDDP